jgi:hypothetical protein
MRQHASMLLLSVGLTLGLLVAMSYSLFKPGFPSAQAITVDLIDRDLGEVLIATPDVLGQLAGAAGRVEQVVYCSLTNGGRKPVVIVGVEDECGQNACMSVLVSERIVIQPGDSVRIPCKVSVKRTLGPFAAGAWVHVDEGSLRTIRLSVHGTVVASDAPASP